MRFTLRLLSALLVGIATLVIAVGGLVWAVAALLNSFSTND